MKLIIANLKADNEQTILSALSVKERSIRKKGISFFKDGKTKWKHIKYNGWVTVTNAPKNILLAKVQSKSKVDEAKIFEAFVSYLTRHCGELIKTLTICYL